jgi:2-methylisocitrate lyase-like PEP mutase family enzyme
MEAPNAAFGVDDLADAGVKRISVGVALAQAAYGALIKAARQIAENGRFQFGDTAIGYAELEAFFERLSNPLDPGP